jgi:hypothetical protein
MGELCSKSLRKEMDALKYEARLEATPDFGRVVDCEVEVAQGPWHTLRTIQSK